MTVHKKERKTKYAFLIKTIHFSLNALATYPLDLTKTRLQIQGEGNKAKPNGLVTKVKFNESFKSLFFSRVSYHFGINTLYFG